MNSVTLHTDLKISLYPFPKITKKVSGLAAISSVATVTA